MNESAQDARLRDAIGRQPALRVLSTEIEQARRVPASLVADLARAGHYRMLVPASLGGGEVHPRVFVDVLRALGQGDSATAWTVMTGATTGLLSAYLPRQGATELFSDPASVFAGVFAPMGRAVSVDGGYRLSGRWPFASGVENAEVRLGGALVFEDGRPRLLASGEPEIRSLFVRAEQSSVVDTWRTTGLRGTGSHDMLVEDVFVPDCHTACVFTDAPTEAGPLYRFPLFGLLALGVSAVGLGIARASLDELAELATRKRRGRRALAETELAQLRRAEAEGELLAAEALIGATIDAVWSGEGALGAQGRASLRLAATHAARAAARVVDAAYHLGGGASIYDSSPLQRHFRDVHTMTQHIMVSEISLKPVGRVLFGLPTDLSQL